MAGGGGGTVFFLSACVVLPVLAGTVACPVTELEPTRFTVCAATWTTGVCCHPYKEIISYNKECINLVFYSFACVPLFAHVAHFFQKWGVIHFYHNSNSFSYFFLCQLAFDDLSLGISRCPDRSIILHDLFNLMEFLPSVQFWTIVFSLVNNHDLEFLIIFNDFEGASVCIRSNHNT